jgi:predicted AlkP superfamily phosphohydrolase/phosphomutase
VAAPLLEEGKLPNLARLASEGVSGPLRSFMPFLSPRIWNTIATGKVPEKHGIKNWARDDGKLYRGDDRNVHALWNIVSTAGLSVGVVNWLTTYPPEHIHGVMVSDHAIPGQAQGRQLFANKLEDGNGADNERDEPKQGAPEEDVGPVTYPAAWRERLVSILENDRHLVRRPDPFRDQAEFAPWTRLALGTLREAQATDERVARIALEVDSELSPDVLMVLLQGIDRVSHLLWGNLEPAEHYPEYMRPSPPQRQAGAAALREYYEYTDALIGILLDRFDSDDLVVIVSDHGFEAGGDLWFNTTGGHDTAAAQDGVIFARGPRVPPAAQPGPMTVNDITPMILAWLGLAVAEDMDGHPPPWLEVTAIGSIATYDTSVIERLGSRPSGAEGALIEQLRSLGYIK